MSELKTEIMKRCKSNLTEKITLIESEIQKLDASQASETKSSAGDKYETSREMMQRERDQLSANLHNNRLLLNQLTKLDISKKNIHVEMGSLVETSQCVYWIAIGLGNLIIEGQTIFVISLSSPIGKLLLGKKIGDSFLFNGTLQTIITVS